MREKIYRVLAYSLFFVVILCVSLSLILCVFAFLFVLMAETKLNGEKKKARMYEDKCIDKNILRETDQRSSSIHPLPPSTPPSWHIKNRSLLDSE